MRLKLEKSGINRPRGRGRCPLRGSLRRSGATSLLEKPVAGDLIVVFTAIVV